MSWRSSLLLVAAVYLLTFPGTWIVTDQAEALFTARRLVEHGTLRLGAPGVSRVPELPWVRGDASSGLHSRFLPLVALSLAPLVALDQALGAGEPLREGALAHLQGCLLTLAALALLGWSARRLGAGPSATAGAVLLAGLSWPVWRAALRGGAEPIMLLLVTVYLAGVACERGEPARLGRGAWLQALACLLLPWSNPAGTILGGAIVAAALLERVWPGADRSAGSWWPPLAGTVLGNLGVMAAWNYAYQGDLWRGGYAPYDVIRFAETPLLRGLGLYVGGAVAEAAPLIAFAVLVALRLRQPRLLVRPVTLAAVVIAVFATHYLPEPTRRLAPVWPAWALVAAIGWERVRPARLAWLLVVVQALLGFHGFVQEHGRYYPGPQGLFYPHVLWVGLAIHGHPWWQTALPAAALVALAGWAAIRVRSLAMAAAEDHRAAA